ncbi:anti-phage protein KwaA [Aquitalea denitrificans]|uniref:anti-phage protein KwaA n=1 Tax=Aquitalea denitrificans TaxID=519081 RepID=UPI00135BE653|nr:anti-phage protein KwaA [Aquitalea denitrificans]
MDASPIRMSRLIKIGMYLLSLWLLLVLIFVNKIDIDLCFDCKFASLAELWSIVKKNYLPSICVLVLVISIGFYAVFARVIQGAKDGPFKVSEIEDKSADHLVFLATYVIPLLSFNLDTTRQVISLLITLTLIGVIYIRTNLFYANPTLSLLGFKICTVKFEQLGPGIPSGTVVLIAREDIYEGASVNILRLDKNIFFARKAISIKL